MPTLLNSCSLVFRLLTRGGRRQLGTAQYPCRVGNLSSGSQYSAQLLFNQPAPKSFSYPFGRSRPASVSLFCTLVLAGSESAAGRLTLLFQSLVQWSVSWRGRTESKSGRSPCWRLAFGPRASLRGLDFESTLCWVRTCGALTLLAQHSSSAFGSWTSSCPPGLGGLLSRVTACGIEVSCFSCTLWIHSRPPSLALEFRLRSRSASVCRRVPPLALRLSFLVSDTC